LSDDAPAHLTKNMEKVWSSPDAWLPFRECAPSRRRMLESDGPFIAESLCTLAGLFSILIWRGITFGCQVVLDHPTRYENLAAWEAIALAHNNDPSYLCNINAYTTPNNGRTPDLATDYWTAAQTVEEDWKKLVSDPDLSYTKLFNFFIQDKPVVPKPPKGGWPKRAPGQLLPYACQPGLFPQIGNLTAHLLAADCHYALIGTPPPADVMGKTIYTLDMGALNGMQKLGLLQDGPRNAIPQLEVVEAFKNLYAFLDAELSQDHKKHMGFDLIMVEHLICKYSKLHPAVRAKDSTQKKRQAKRGTIGARKSR